MKITLDFKGQTGTTELGKLNLLTGPNGSGKSARLEALRFAVQGDVPEGKRLEDVWKYAHRTTMLEVGVQLDDGFHWSRYVHRDARTEKLSMGLSCDGFAVPATREFEARLAKRVGAFAPTFDLGTFLGLSDDKRRDFVLDLCGRHVTRDRDVEMVDQIARAYLAESLGEGTAKLVLEGGAFSRDVAKTRLAPREFECLEQTLKQMEGKWDTLPEALAACLAKAKELTNGAKQAKDHAHQAARKLSEQKAGLTVRTESLPELEKSLAGLRERATQLRESIADQAGRQAARDAINTELRGLAAHLKSNEVRRDEWVNIEAGGDPEALDHEAAALDPGPAPTFDNASWRERMAETAKKRLAAMTAAEDAKRMIIGLAGALTDAEQRAAEQRDDPWREALKLARAYADQLGDGGRNRVICPESWDALMAHIEKHARQSDQTDWEANLRETKAAYADAETKVKETQAELDAVNKTAQAMDDEYAEKMRVQDAAATAWGERARAAEAKRRHAAEARRQIADREAEIARINERIEEIDAQRLDAEKRLRDLDDPAGVAVEQLQESLELVQRQIADQHEEVERTRQYDVLDRELTKCIASAERETVTWEVCKRLADAIRSLRERIMAELVAPLMDRIDRFLVEAHPGYKCYCELENARGRPVLELGWSDGERRTPLPSMSGGETALFGAGLAYALVTLANPPVRLLLLEAAEIDELKFASILRAFARLAGNLDHVIVARHSLGFDPSITGQWTVIRCGDGHGTD